MTRAFGGAYAFLKRDTRFAEVTSQLHLASLSRLLGLVLCFGFFSLASPHHHVLLHIEGGSAIGVHVAIPDSERLFQFWLEVDHLLDGDGLTDAAAMHP